MQDKHRNKAIKINVKSGNRLSPVDMIGNTALLYQTARGCTSSMILAICISLVMTISFILAIRFCMCYFVSINWQTYRRCAALSFMPHRLPQRIVPGSTNISAVVL